MARLPKEWLIALSVPIFAISGGCSAFMWRIMAGFGVLLIPLVFGLPLMLLCGRWERVPCWLWLIVNFEVFYPILFFGAFFLVFLELGSIGIAILGLLGALAFAGAFSLLIRRIRRKELAWLAGAGLFGGIVFAATGRFVHSGWMGGDYLPSPVGFAAWQVAVGTVLVWMASRGE
ncbi:MAG: hypothetical protein ACLQGV_10535 [Bryobacteraceae bacterium]